MTIGALIVLETFIALVIVFGIYAGYHREDDKPQHKKSNRNNVGASH